MTVTLYNATVDAVRSDATVPQLGRECGTIMSSVGRDFPGFVPPVRPGQAFLVYQAGNYMGPGDSVAEALNRHVVEPSLRDNETVRFRIDTYNQVVDVERAPCP